MYRFLRLPTFLGLGVALVAVLAIVLMMSGGLRTAHADDAEPPTITLEPETAINDLGTEHTVTATVEMAGEAMEGELVAFQIVGDDSPNAGAVGTCSDNADCTTDGDGKVSFTYTGDGAAGVDTIQACFFDEAAEEDVCDTATKEWVGLHITLDPPTATNPVGTEHTVTATVTFGVGDEPVVGEPVAIFVSDGPNAAEGFGEQDGFVLDATNDKGELALTYPGDGGPGTDTIVAVAFCEVIDAELWCVMVGPEEEFLEAEATKDWVQPTPTPTPAPTPAALPASGGAPSDGGSTGLGWLAAIAGAIAVTAAGGFWFAYQRRRVR